MFIPDMPNVPPQEMPMMIAQAGQAQSGDATKIRTLGVCRPSPNNNYSLDNGTDPILLARDYLWAYENRTVTGPATTTVLQQPKHGVLRLVTQADVGTILPSGGDPVDPAAALYFYLPDPIYTGKDTATIQVDFGNGLKVNVKHYFQVIDHGLAENWMEFYCGKTGTFWKISSTLNPDGTNTITSVEYQSAIIDAGATTTDTAASAYTLSASVLSTFSVDPSLVTFNLADLAGGAVGQAVGNTITLDDNAAGHNWFIDTTPADNSEYLPTSNPFEWVAKEGTAAYGKMDMLSVLLHEYGHALGIEHSADNHDYMATTLTPGVRRMPSAEELALMQELVGVAKGEMIATSTPSPTLPLQGGGGLPIPLGAGIGLAFLGRMRKSSYGGTSIDVVGMPSITHYAVAANATFVGLNGVVGGAPPTMPGGARPTLDGWLTQGGMSFENGVATLNEVSTSQTRLSQVFMLNEQDRYLSFTLSGTALDNLTGAPDDAFEVALLDATTGLSVLGSDGLTRTDAFLNLQGDGSEHAATSVTRIDNADGSRTYRVDLTGVTKNRAVNLSFDLLGFGAANSRVTLRDIRVSGLPQLRDEAATLLEDNLLSFDPYAQADAQPSLNTCSHFHFGLKKGF